MSQYCKLIMVTPDNNNKFYIMEEKNGEIHIEYGRIDHTSTKLTKPLKEWNSIYKSKTKKGYKDVTDFVTEKVLNDNKSQSVTLVKIKDTKVDEFINLMKRYTDGLVQNTYSVTCKNVTEFQVNEAQKLLDQLNKIDINKNENLFNEKLIELYTIIPRKIKDVRKAILPHIDYKKTLEQEQDNLDAMESQVKMLKNENEQEVDIPKQQTLLDVIGISMKETNPNNEIQYLIDQIKSTKYKIKGLFETNNPKEDKIFNNWIDKASNKKTRVLIHGTRCSSVIPILKTQLQIRPSGNFQFSGKVYGDACYFSEVVSKSLNYTGYDPDKILLVYEVHIGNPFIYNGWYKGNSFALTYKNLQERGFDSTYVKAGNGLLNSEIVIYTENQYRIKYIIWLK